MVMAWVIAIPNFHTVANRQQHVVQMVRGWPGAQGVTGGTAWAHTSIYIFS